jgi:hypothetical protein
MADRKPSDGLSEGFPPERRARIKANASRLSAQQNGVVAELDAEAVREREAVLDELVADAQENDMGYER